MQNIRATAFATFAIFSTFALILSPLCLADYIAEPFRYSCFGSNGRWPKPGLRVEIRVDKFTAGFPEGSFALFDDVEKLIVKRSGSLYWCSSCKDVYTFPKEESGFQGTRVIHSNCSENECSGVAAGASPAYAYRVMMSAADAVTFPSGAKVKTITSGTLLQVPLKSFREPYEYYGLTCELEVH